MDFLIVGLGNPGAKYASSRHNVGFMVVDNLAKKIGIPMMIENKFKGIYGKTVYKGKKVHLLKPQTFMNNSGESVRLVKNFYKIPSEQLIVVHDDMDLPFGRIKIKKGGGTGGHKGLESITKDIGTKDYIRVRIGIGKPSSKEEVVKYVLSNFTPEEQRTLSDYIDKASQAIIDIIEKEVSRAMNKYNQKLS